MTAIFFHKNLTRKYETEFVTAHETKRLIAYLNANYIHSFVFIY